MYCATIRLTETCSYIWCFSSVNGRTCEASDESFASKLSSNEGRGIVIIDICSVFWLLLLFIYLFIFNVYFIDWFNRLKIIDGDNGIVSEGWYWEPWRVASGGEHLLEYRGRWLINSIPPELNFESVVFFFILIWFCTWKINSLIFFIAGRKARTVAGVDFEVEGKW